MKQFAICSVLFLLGFSLYGQHRIEGQITDLEGNSLNKVVVRIKNSDLKTQSDSAGYFSMNFVEKGNSILFSKDGFLEQATIIKSDFLQIKLLKQQENYFGMSLEDLTKIKVVSSSKSIVPITQAPATVMVITKEQIRSRGYQELDDALRDIPGIDLTRVHGVFPTIRTMRGSYGDENKRILLMIDGIVENQLIGSWELGGPIYSLHNIERIEVIWGPASALYGANAFGGIIHLISKSAGKKDRLEYSKGFGTFNTKYDKFALNFKKKKLMGTFSGTLFNTDGPQFTNRHPDFSDAYVEDAYSFMSRIIYSGEKLTSTFGTTLFHLPTGDGTFGMSATKLLGLPDAGNLNQGNLGWLPFNINDQRPSKWHAYTETFFIEENWRVNKRLNLILKLHYRETGIGTDSYSYQQYSNDPVLVRKNRLAHKSYQYSAETQVDYHLNENNSLISGIQYTHTNLEKGYRKTTEDTTSSIINSIRIKQLNTHFLPRENTIQQNVGIYSQYMLATEFLNYTSFTLGARFDYNSIYGSTFNPRLGIVVKPTPQLVVKALYGKAYRAPTNFEMYSGFPGVRINNEELKPEKIKTYEVNLSYKFDWIFLQSNTFFNHLSDLIVASVPIEENLTQNQNRGSATIYGGELIANFDLSKRLDGFVNFSYQHAEQTDIETNYMIPNIAKYKGNAGLNIYIAELFSLAIIENWVGKRSVAGTNPLGKLPGYLVSNISINSSRFMNDHLSLNLKINNLLNVQYNDPGIRSADGYGFYSTVHEQVGRTVFLTLTFNL